MITEEVKEVVCKKDEIKDPEKIKKDDIDSPSGSKSLSETIRNNDIGHTKLELPVRHTLLLESHSYKQNVFTNVAPFMFETA